MKETITTIDARWVYAGAVEWTETSFPRSCSDSDTKIMNANLVGPLEANRSGW